MSFSLDIEGVVRIHLQDIQAITIGIVVSVNVNVLPVCGQYSVAVYVHMGLVVGGKRLQRERLTIDVESQGTTVVIAKVEQIFMIVAHVGGTKY